MWDCESFQYFVVIVDVYTMNIYTRPLKTKLASEMKTALEDIFVNDLKLYPEKLAITFFLTKVVNLKLS